MGDDSGERRFRRAGGRAARRERNPTKQRGTVALRAHPHGGDGEAAPRASNRHRDTRRSIRQSAARSLLLSRDARDAPSDRARRVVSSWVVMLVTLGAPSDRARRVVPSWVVRGPRSSRTTIASQQLEGTAKRRSSPPLGSSARARVAIVPRGATPHTARRRRPRRLPCRPTPATTTPHLRRVGVPR